MGVIRHKPFDPIVVNLSEYDHLSQVKASDLPDWYDALVINAGGDFTFVGGTGGGIQIIFILKGKDQGMYVYRSSLNANLGLNLSLGASTGFINFNEQNSARTVMDPAAFTGKGQGWSAGAGVFGGGIAISYVDGKWHPENTGGLVEWNHDESIVLYRAYTGSTPLTVIPTDVQVGAQFTFSKSSLFSWGRFPFIITR